MTSGLSFPGIQPCFFFLLIFGQIPLRFFIQIFDYIYLLPIIAKLLRLILHNPSRTVHRFFLTSWTRILPPGLLNVAPIIRLRDFSKRLVRLAQIISIENEHFRPPNGRFQFHAHRSDSRRFPPQSYRVRIFRFHGRAFSHRKSPCRPVDRR